MMILLLFCGLKEPAQKLLCSIEALWPELGRLLLSSWLFGVDEEGNNPLCSVLISLQNGKQKARVQVELSI